jgi:hypothetical protein
VLFRIITSVFIMLDKNVFRARGENQFKTVGWRQKRWPFFSIAFAAIERVEVTGSRVDHLDHGQIIDQFFPPPLNSPSPHD